MRNVSDKRYGENQNTHFVFSNYFSKIVLFTKKFGEKKYTTGRPAANDNMAPCAFHAEYLRL
jgi:hypothetical protein